MEDGSIIKKYKIRKGISPHLNIPEYGLARRKHPTKDREISEALEFIYLARTEYKTRNVEPFLERAWNKAEEAGCTLYELGLSNEEALYILDVNKTHIAKK